MEIGVGTVDALLSSPDLPLREPPHVRLSGSIPNSVLGVFTETPLHGHDGSVDSHRELHRESVAQCFPVEWAKPVRLNIPPSE